MTGLTQDLRFAIRSLVRHWRFALGVVLSLGTGLGLGLPAFSLADHLFLRPPPGVTRAGDVVRLVQRTPNPQGGWFFNSGLTGLDYTELSRRLTTADGVAAWASLGMSLGRGPDARRVSTIAASPSYFGVLGLRPFLGRFFGPDEDVPGAKAGPAVVTHRFWRVALGADSAALGRRLDIGSVSYTVVGVAPEGFEGVDLGTVDVIVPLRVLTPDFQGDDPELWTTDRSSWLRMAARLRPGATVAAATDEANRIYRTSGPRVRDRELEGALIWDPVQPGRSSLPSVRTRIAVWVTAGAGLLLALVLANLLNLFIARTAAGSRQVAVRLAIGGGRRHLLRLQFLEAAVLGAASAALALVVTAPATRIMRAQLYTGVQWSRAAVDLRVAGIAFGLAVVMGVIVALVSSQVAARVDPATLLRSAGSDRSTTGRGGALVRRGLVIAQATIFAVILAAAAAFITSVQRALAVDLGFDVDRVFAASVPLQSVGYSADAARRFYLDAHPRLAGLPGVESASLGYMEPWQNNRSEPLRIPGFDGAIPFTLFDAVTPEYARTMGLRPRQGRWLAASDVAGNEPVVVVNEAFARTFFRGTPVIGTCIGIGADTLPCRVIVGVVGDARMTGGLDAPVTPAYYVPLAQAAAYRFTPKLFVRSAGRVDDAMARVRAELQRSAADLPVVSVRPLEEDFAPLVSTWRLGRLLFGAFGVLAGFIAAVGLFSVLAFLAAERRRDDAIRLALGAPASKVVAPIVRHTAISIGTGLLLGLAILAAVSSRAESLLFRTTVLEVAVLVPVVLLGLAVGVAAAVAPVRTVLRTNAMAVLREP